MAKSNAANPQIKYLRLEVVWAFTGRAAALPALFSFLLIIFGSKSIENLQFTVVVCHHDPVF